MTPRRRRDRGRTGVEGKLVRRKGEALTGATREETVPVALGAVVMAFLSLVVCYARGYVLLYGDAVAHLGIARRIFDSRNPGLAQLGGVWLPLPHLLMLPFIWRMDWWQNGIAGAWPSLLCYLLAVVGIYRLARRMLPVRWALVATAFFGLNPNLLYLSTTAMTEPLFLAELIWATLLTMECVDAVREGRRGQVASRLLVLGWVIVAAVYTRYDGWILGAAVWCVVTWSLIRRPELWKRVRVAFALFTILAVAAPLGWLAYNQRFFHDPLDFMRGPYSAAAIEKKTSPPGSRHYRGWHNPAWALLFYTRTAQVDAAAWETGFGVMLAALAGLGLTLRRRQGLASLLLWMPLPFYVYSVAYGSIPIFIPQLWPHSYYNARYGMELLPALAVFMAVATMWLETRLIGVWQTGSEEPRTSPMAARVMAPVAFGLIAVNSLWMIYKIPLVLKEGIVNSTTRMALEQALADQLRLLPAAVPILMYNSDHIGALQDAGIPLKRTLNEGDYDSWMAALRDPARQAGYVVAIDGDPVSKAVAAHPEGLTELTVICTTGQPCARVYRSDIYPGVAQHS